jgi:hypothetical protein
VSRCILTLCAILVGALPAFAQNYLGFDKNLYPGDALLPALHKTFAYSGYWLNNPPGMTSNPWAGRRSALRAAGFGFLILYNGRLDAELRDHNPAALGTDDAIAAAAAAQREGFPPHAIIFLDQEEGGRLLPEQAAYIGAWFHHIAQSGYSPGIYCSGITVGHGKDRISTAEDVAERFPVVALWIADDQCPPAPGCLLHAPNPSGSGFSKALVWQFAQSPRRTFAVACGRTYAPDNNCYAPGLPHFDKTFLDLNSSNSSDPSKGR